MLKQKVYTFRIMTSVQWKAFNSFRNDFREQCNRWAETALRPARLTSQQTQAGYNWLAQLQQAAADADAIPSYDIQTPIVYNRALDSVCESDDIKLIVVGDNPGKNEQLEQNQMYLVGQAGKLGDGFFRKNPELGIDFRTNVIILNKTPIHSAKTRQLAFLCRNGGDLFTELFRESQVWMASRTAALQKALDCELWLVGYGELRQNGLFSEYANELRRQYSDAGTRDNVSLFQHFSMNRFSIDLRERSDPKKKLAENLHSIGLFHRTEILGW